MHITIISPSDGASAAAQVQVTAGPLDERNPFDPQFVFSVADIYWNLSLMVEKEPTGDFPMETVTGPDTD